MKQNYEWNVNIVKCLQFQHQSLGSDYKMELNVN